MCQKGKMKTYRLTEMARWKKGKQVIYNLDRNEIVKMLLLSQFSR